MSSVRGSPRCQVATTPRVPSPACPLPAMTSVPDRCSHLNTYIKHCVRPSIHNPPQNCQKIYLTKTTLLANWNTNLTRFGGAHSSHWKLTLMLIIFLQCEKFEGNRACCGGCPRECKNAFNLRITEEKCRKYMSQYENCFYEVQLLWPSTNIIEILIKNILIFHIITS